MNERACAYVCFILAAICAILSWYSMTTGSKTVMPLICFFAVTVVLLSGFVIVCKYVT